VAEVLRQATIHGAEVVRMHGQLGRVAEGYLADLLVVEGDPLADLRVLQDQGAQIAMIIRDGVSAKDSLA
jgi:imidazolonepropionase-like amidohydrolase